MATLNGINHYDNNGIIGTSQKSENREQGEVL